MKTEQLNGAMIFATPDAMFEAMFGPPQHDAHLTRHRHYQWLEARRLADEQSALAVDRQLKIMLARS